MPLVPTPDGYYSEREPQPAPFRTELFLLRGKTNYLVVDLGPVEVGEIKAEVVGRTTPLRPSIVRFPFAADTSSMRYHAAHSSEP